MGRGDWLSRSGLLLGGIVAALVLVVLIAWMRQPPSSAAGAAKMDRSPPGWEIRYSATVGLARRGCNGVLDNLDTFKEMLDEDQQLANFPDELTARETVVNALRALERLHQRRPDLDLKELDPALEKLRRSSNPVLRTEAQRTQLLLQGK